MKKIILLYTFIFCTLTIVAQEWKKTKIDDSVQVTLPVGYKTTDTLGQKIINAQSQFGNIIITVQPDNPEVTPKIEKVKQLDSYYKDFIKRISSTSNGSIQDERDTMLGKLHVKDFTLEVDSGSGKQLRNIRILHENNATYSFQFLYKDIHADYAKAEIEKFFNSIRIPPEADVQTQFTEPGNTTGKPVSGNKNLYIAGGVIILIIIILVIIRRRRQRH